MKKPLLLEQSSEEGEDGLANVYAVNLFFEAEPQIDRFAIQTSLKRRCGKVKDIGTGDASAPWHFAFEDHPATYTDGAVLPAQSLIHLLPEMPAGDDVEQALQQSWDWPETRSAVSKCRSAMLVTDFMAQMLPYKQRLGLFRNVVLATMDAAPPAAIHWRVSQRFVDPAKYRATMEADDADPIDPRTGTSPPNWSSIRVEAASGLEADGLSTALFTLDAAEGRRLLARRGVSARLFDKSGAEVGVTA